MGLCSPQDEVMSRLVLFIAMLVSMTAIAFFNIPQQMYQVGSKMMFPAQDVTKAQPQTLVCDCNCNKQETKMIKWKETNPVKAPAKKKPAKKIAK